MDRPDVSDNGETGIILWLDDPKRDKGKFGIKNSEFRYRFAMDFNSPELKSGRQNGKRLRKYFIPSMFNISL